MAKLAGKNIVVAGGTGRVGEGLVRAFLLEGAQVIVPVRSTAKDQRLRSYVEGIETGKLFCLPTHVGEEGSIQEFRKRVLAEFKRIDLAVACLGGWYYGYPPRPPPISTRRCTRSARSTIFDRSARGAWSECRRCGGI